MQYANEKYADHTVCCSLPRYSDSMVVTVAVQTFKDSFSRDRHGSYRNDPKFSDRYTWANSADPDQTAPRGAV